jgi:PAS domain S-box-containing protein
MDPRTNIEFFLLLSSSYQRLLAESLVPPGLDPAAGTRWLYDSAPFGVLAHNLQAEPVFTYGNQRAQAIFGYDWNEITTLPSRLSAEAPERGERQAFLEQVKRDGFVKGYRGVRITKEGTRFWIESATVWQLVDEQGVLRGQAAMIPNIAAY